MTDKLSGVMFAGLPGSGKSTAAEYLHDVYGGTHIKVGENVKQWAANDSLENPSSDELGEYAAEQREKFGDGFAIRRLVKRWERGENGENIPNGPVWIDSVRCREGYLTMRDYLDTSQFIWFESDWDIRLERIRARARNDEGDFTMADLQERDRREMEDLGVKTLLQHGDMDKVVVNNYDELNGLKRKLDDVVWTDALNVEENSTSDIANSSANSTE